MADPTTLLTLSGLLNPAVHAEAEKLRSDLNEEDKSPAPPAEDPEPWAEHESPEDFFDRFDRQMYAQGLTSDNSFWIAEPEIISHDYDCLLQATDHVNRCIWQFAVNKAKIAALSPFFKTLMLSDVWGDMSKKRIVVKEVDGEALRWMLCAASWPGDQLLKSKLRSLPPASINELISINDRFLIHPEVIERPLLCWEDGRPDSTTPAFLAKRFCLYYHLQTTANFKQFVNRLIFETPGPLPPADTVPEGVLDESFLRKPFDRVAGICFFVRHRLIYHILDRAAEERKRLYLSRRSNEGRRRYWSIFTTERWLELRFQRFPEETLDMFAASVLKDSEFELVLTRSPGFEGLCLDCAKRSFLAGDSEHHECWKTWVEADGWDEGCNVSHGVCVFMDSFLG